jgi:hypothetical protein
MSHSEWVYEHNEAMQSAEIDVHLTEQELIKFLIVDGEKSTWIHKHLLKVCVEASLGDGYRSAVGMLDCEADT